MEDKDYFKHSAISNSDLIKLREKGTKYFWHYKFDLFFEKEETSDSMLFGSLLHLMILEPDRFGEKYATFHGDRPNSGQAHKFCSLVAGGMAPETAFSKSYSDKGKTPQKIKEAAAEKYSEFCGYINCLLETKGKTFIENRSIEKAETMLKELIKHPFAQHIRFLESQPNVTILREKVIIWIDPITGIECKAKLDELIIDHARKVVDYNDYKTTFKCGVHEFLASIESYRYDRQGAYYKRAAVDSGLLAALGVTDEYQINVNIIALCTQAPFMVNTYSFSGDALTSATHEIVQDMQVLKTKMPFRTERDAWNEWQGRGHSGHFVIEVDKNGKPCVDRTA